MHENTEGKQRHEKILRAEWAKPPLPEPQKTERLAEIAARSEQRDEGGGAGEGRRMNATSINATRNTKYACFFCKKKKFCTFILKNLYIYKIFRTFAG